MTDLARRAAEVALAAAREASELVMRVYATAFEVAYKGKDDPVTRADHEANALLCDRLSRAFPGLPIVAEESDPARTPTSRRRGGLVRRPARRHARVRREERRVRGHDRARRARAGDARRHHGAGVGAGVHRRRRRGRMGGRGRRDAQRRSTCRSATRSTGLDGRVALAYASAARRARRRHGRTRAGRARELGAQGGRRRHRRVRHLPAARAGGHAMGRVLERGHRAGRGRPADRDDAARRSTTRRRRSRTLAAFSRQTASSTSASSTR